MSGVSVGAIIPRKMKPSQIKQNTIQRESLLGGLPKSIYGKTYGEGRSMTNEGRSMTPTQWLESNGIKMPMGLVKDDDVIFYVKLIQFFANEPLTYVMSDDIGKKKIANNLFNDKIQGYMKDFADEYVKRTSVVRTTPEGLSKIKEEVGKDLFPKFRSGFIVEVEKLVTPKVEPKKDETTITTTTTTNTPTPTTTTPTITPKADKGDDTDKMILYGGIGLVVLSLLMSD